MIMGKELKFIPPTDDLSKYKVQMILNGKTITMVPESLLIAEMDKKQHAEEILEMIANDLGTVIINRLPSINEWEKLVRGNWDDLFRKYLAKYIKRIVVPCKHEPSLMGYFHNYKKHDEPFNAYDNKCRHCGVRLQETWIEKNENS